MERRDLLAWLGGGLGSGAAPASGPFAPRGYDSAVPAYQACLRATEDCIAHCQQLLEHGDATLGACLRTAQDADVVCATVLKLADLNSAFTPALARGSVAVMQACVQACREHLAGHAECRACHDACLEAIDAARLLA